MAHKSLLFYIILHTCGVQVGSNEQFEVLFLHIAMISPQYRAIGVHPISLSASYVAIKADKLSLVMVMLMVSARVLKVIK